MATPTISTAGTLSNLLLITTDEGAVHRIPFVSGAVFTDTSNADAYRVDVLHSNGEITLKFASSAEVATALAAIDALY